MLKVDTMASMEEAHAGAQSAPAEELNVSHKDEKKLLAILAYIGPLILVS